MDQLSDLVDGVTIEPTALLDIALTALLIYGLFSLIQGTRAVRLVIGAIVLYGVYVLAQALDLRLLSGIMQTGAVVGLLALVVIFQPELRRALERIGRVGSLGWALSPAGAPGSSERIARTIARTASTLAASRIGGLMVIERETGLEDAAETGVMLHADLSEELLASIFAPRGALHDGAVIIRGDSILAAGAVLPLSEASMTRERLGTRHRAAMGITEQTDALAVVVSEETGGISLVQRGRVLRDLDEERLRTALASLLRPGEGRGRAAAGLSAFGRAPFARGKRPRGLRGRRLDHRPTAAASSNAPNAETDTPATGSPVSPASPVASVVSAPSATSAATTPRVAPPSAAAPTDAAMAGPGSGAE